MDIEIQSDDDFEQIHENRLLFLKEAILQGEYVVNPKAIAARWLLGVDLVESVDECPID